MKTVTMFSPRFKLRWGYEYLDGKTKRGMWSRPGIKPVDQAWANNTNVAYAFIERKDERSGEVKLICRCSKDEFLVFQWISLARVGNVMSIKKDVSPLTLIGGLTMLTTKQAVDCYSGGEIKVNEPRNLNTNFSTFGS